MLSWNIVGWHNKLVDLEFGKFLSLSLFIGDLGSRKLYIGVARVQRLFASSFKDVRERKG